MGKSKKHVGSSNAAGGPATAAGIDFQVDIAVARVLEGLARFLNNPLEELQCSMEPRIFSDDSTVTSWDFRVGPPEMATEAKLQPKRQDVLEWLDRVEIGAQQDHCREFELVYGRGAPPIIREIERLKRIAVEAGSDLDEFAKRVRLERNDQTDLVLAHLKTAPNHSLPRVHVISTDPESLSHRIKTLLQFLVREPQRQSLHDLLVGRIRKSIVRRTTFKLQEVYDEATQVGLELCAPAAFEPASLDPIVADAVYILQRCEFGIPGEVLSKALSVSVVELETHLAPYVEQRRIIRTDDLWTIVLRKPLLARPNGAQHVADALRHLLEFYRANKRLPSARRQVPNALSLAKACDRDAPELVAGLFSTLDKSLKQAGDKRRVLEVAEMSISAAKNCQIEAATKGKAVALICGQSWVYQRIGRLDEARAAGERSLQLGQDLKWDRNTAFCYKCLGRLNRMVAERNRTSKEVFGKLINRSIDFLKQAIDLFPRITETNLDHAGECGDCYSLLGRTYLVAGDFRHAEGAAREASRLLTDEKSKDYADLQILLGDLAARHDRDAAIAFYDQAFQVAGVADAERSEIAARALFRKGHVEKSPSCLEKAAAIWDRLEEDENAAKARWLILLLTDRVPGGSQKVLEMVQPAVRVEAVRMHEERLAELKGPSRGRRSTPDRNYWGELVELAKTNVAIRTRDW